MFNFNLENVEVQSNDFEAMPKGNYNCLLEKIEWKQSANNASTWMFSIMFTVIEGEYENRKVFTNLCLQHSNPKVIEIAQSKLKSLFIACGYTPEQMRDLNPEKTCQMLLDRTMTVYITNKSGNNDASGFKPLEMLVPKSSANQNNGGGYTPSMDDIPF